MKVAIVTGCSKDHSFGPGVLLLNLLATQPYDFDFFVVSDEQDSASISVMRSFHPRVLEVNLDARFRERKFASSPSIRFFTPNVMAKAHCLTLMSDYDWVVWLDYDLIVFSNFFEHVPFDSESDAFFPSAGHLVEQFWRMPKDLDPYSPGYATGTFFLNCKSEKLKNQFESALGVAKKWAPFLYMPDQAVFSHVLNSSGADVGNLEDDLWVRHPKQGALDSTVILHSYGPSKFWITGDSPIWNENYKEWLRRGGSPFLASKKSFPNPGRLAGSIYRKFFRARTLARYEI